LVVLKDKIAVLGPDLGLEPSVLVNIPEKGKLWESSDGS